MPQPHAIILFAHGSRDPLWRAPLEAVATRIRSQQPSLPVECAYLELCTPDLPTVTTNLVAAYARSTVSGGINTPFFIRIVPMFLGMGKHAREDLPALVLDLQQAHPAVRFEVTPAVGEDARVTALLAQIASS
jgi:sirohydrochlorin cobaltochelatase